MPGIIEENDDSAETAGVSSVTYAVGSPVAPTEVELEVEADRLRFMGLDHTLIDEFVHRARSDLAAAQEWLGDRLADLTRPLEPPTCDCGEMLVRPEWRGAAADPYGDYGPEDVIEGGLPPLPTGIEPGTCFPVAAWEGAGHAAVLYVCRHASGEFEFPGDEYGDEIECLVRDENGWYNPGSGGGDWVNVFDPPRELLDKYVVLGTGTTSFSDGDDAVHFTGALCSAQVAAVETVDPDGVRRAQIDPTRPFFLAGVRGHGHVRVLDDAGEVLRDWRGERLEWELGAD